MKKSVIVKIEDIFLDNSIYPRSSIDHKRVAMFEESMRDGFTFDPIQLQEQPDEPLIRALKFEEKRFFKMP